MKSVKTLLLFLSVAFVFVACDSDDSSYAASWKYDYSNSFNYVLNVGSGKGAVYAGAKYSIEFMSDGKATVVVENVRFAQGMPEIDMELSGLSWTLTSNSFMTIKAKDVIPVVDGEAMPEYTIDQLTIGVLDRSSQNDHTVFNISYSVLGGSFQVVAIPTQVKYYGVTDVRNIAASTDFSTTDPCYVISFSEDLTADVDIYGAKFAQNMPAQNMSFNDIPVVVTSNGYTLAISDLVPEIAGVPYPNYPITNFNAVADFASGVDVYFNCMEVFAVSADLGYHIPSDNI